MRLDEFLDKVQPETKVAVRFDDKVEVKTAMDHICYYGGEEDIHCSEIEPDGYTDADGISYLVFHAYNIQDRKQCDDELPFPK